MATFLSTPAQPTYQTKTAKTAHVAAFITTKPTFLPLKTWPTLTAKERLRQQLHLLSYQSGLSSIYARLKQASVATILMYHSIPTEQEAQWTAPENCISASTFEQQMRFLSQHRRVISLDKLIAHIKSGKPIERGTVVITFDDGYRNNFTVAAPILAKYNLPATIYLATSYVNAAQNQWVDTLYAALRTCSEYQLNLSDSNLLAPDFSASVQDSWNLGSWNLTDPLQREQAYDKLTDYLIEADVLERQTLLAEIDRQLAPRAYPPRLTLNWDEVRQIQRQYPKITLGIHTANHLDLSLHEDQTAQEMATSIEHMVSETGMPPTHFSFPYNRYTAKAQAQVAASQIASAVAVAEDPVVRSDTSLYALPRLSAPPSLLMLKSWTNGGFPDVSRKLFNRIWTIPY